MFGVPACRSMVCGHTLAAKKLDLMGVLGGMWVMFGGIDGVR